MTAKGGRFGVSSVAVPFVLAGTVVALAAFGRVEVPPAPPAPVLTARPLAVAAQLPLPGGPVAVSYAVQVGPDIIVATTFGDTKPVRVCASWYTLDDYDFEHPVLSHCDTPASNVGTVDVWRDRRITAGNFAVVLIFPDRPAVAFYLVYPDES